MYQNVSAKALLFSCDAGPMRHDMRFPFQLTNYAFKFAFKVSDQDPG